MPDYTKKEILSFDTNNQEPKPALADIDGDGDLDLLVGKSDGYLDYFSNTGDINTLKLEKKLNNDNPLNGVKFDSSSAPVFHDVDGDGLLDVVIGGREGKLRYFKNIGTKSKPQFSEQTGGSNPFRDINVGLNSTPAFVDLDGNSVADLVVGNIDGQLAYYKNMGTVTSPNFVKQGDISNPFRVLNTDGSFSDVVRVGAKAVTAFGDLNLDGKIDALIADNQADIFYLENVGTISNPKFIKKNLLFNYQSTGYKEGALAITDIENDGDLDIVIGAKELNDRNYIDPNRDRGKIWVYYDRTPAPTVSISSATVVEGNGTKQISFKVLLSAPFARTVEVEYQTADGTAKAGSDYIATNGKVVFKPTETEKTVTIDILDDSVYEIAETVNVNVTKTTAIDTNATIGGVGSGGVITIKDNENNPPLIVENATVIEGDTGDVKALVKVSLAYVSDVPLEVTITPVEGVAKVDRDYDPTPQKLTFAPGEVTKTFEVGIASDRLPEDTEKFGFNVSYAVLDGGVTKTATATGEITVLDNEPILKISHIKQASENLNGLTGYYFNNRDLTDLKLVRTDRQINFDWKESSPSPELGVDTFSVRWLGKVDAPVDGEYTFYTSSDDGIRLWVNGELLVDKWIDRGNTEDSAKITLDAGKLYDIKLEYYDNAVDAVAKLSWSAPGIDKQIIPERYLHAYDVDGYAANIGYVELESNYPIGIDQGIWVDYLRSGTAVSGIDYVSSEYRKVSDNPATQTTGVIIPKNDKTARIYVVVQGDATKEVDEEIKIDIIPTSFQRGLKAEYYDNKDFTNLKKEQIDSNIDFNWGSGTPVNGVQADTFSIRWTGKLRAPNTGKYTFETAHDDGMKVWINGKIIIDKSLEYSFFDDLLKRSSNQPSIDLVAGQFYDIKVEYSENTGDAIAKLLWTGPGIAKQVIPQEVFYPPHSDYRLQDSQGNLVDKLSANLTITDSNDYQVGVLIVDKEGIAIDRKNPLFGNNGNPTVGIKLTSQPTDGKVSLDLTSIGFAKNLTFDATNWDKPQFVELIYVSTDVGLKLAASSATTAKEYQQFKKELSIPVTLTPYLKVQEGESLTNQLLDPRLSIVAGKDIVEDSPLPGQFTIRLDRPAAASGSVIRYTETIAEGNGLLVGESSVDRLVEVSPGAQSVVLPVFANDNQTPGDVKNVSIALNGLAGLTGEYYGDREFKDLKFVRTDRAIDFNWGSNAPDPSAPKDNFSVRWTGKIQSKEAGEYIFDLGSDDGARLWVNGQQIINIWVDRGRVSADLAKIELEANKAYDIKVEYYDSQGDASIQLGWQGPGFDREIVSAERLYPTVKGLTASYYNDKNLTDLKFQQIDPNIDYLWGEGTADPRLNKDNFSVKWLGEIEVPTTGNYVFYGTTDDGFRLSINNNLLIDEWKDRGPTESAKSVFLEAGKRHKIELDYFENTGGASAQLKWSGPGIEKQIVPQSVLYPSTIPVPTAELKIRDNDSAVIEYAVVDTTVNSDRVDLLTVTTLGNVRLGENNQSQVFELQLAKKPSSEVVVNLKNSAASDRLSVERLVFTPDNWDIAQKVVLESGNLVDRAKTSIDVEATSQDSSYDRITTALNILPVYSRLERIITSEDGDRQVIAFRLSSKPRSDVKVEFNFYGQHQEDSAFVGEVQLSTESLVFKADNWDKYQSVILTGLNDNLIDGDVDLHLQARLKTDDFEYSKNQVLNLKIRNLDNDNQIDRPSIGSDRPKPADVPLASLAVDTNTIGEDRDNQREVTINLDRPAGTEGVNVYFDTSNSRAELGKDYSIFSPILLPLENPFENIDIGNVADPIVKDFDNDGDLDLAVGSATGEIKYYRNDSNDVEYKYTELDATDLTANPFGSYNSKIGNLNTGASSIALDGDNIIVRWQRFNKLAFLNETSGGPDFNYFSLRVPDADTNPLNGVNSLRAFTQAKPTIADLNGDGKADLIIGRDRTIELYQKQADESYQQVTNSSINKIIIDENDALYPSVVDWDRDGDLDLFVAHQDGKIDYYENRGDRANADFQLAADRNPLANINPGERPNLFFTDLDSDTDLDVVVGTADGKIQYFQHFQGVKIAAGETSAKFKIDVKPDFVDEGDETIEITLVDLPNSQYNIKGDSASDFQAEIKILEDDKVGVKFILPEILKTSENGGKIDVGVQLTSQPIHDVHIYFGSNDTREGKLKITDGEASEVVKLTFTPANWNISQNVQIVAQDDNIVDGEVPYQIVINVRSEDFGYYRLPVDRLNISNTDNDIAGITVTPIASLTEGRANTYTVRLNTKPLQPVEITMKPTDGEIQLQGSDFTGRVSLSFDETNWDIPQIVGLQPVDDNIVEGLHVSNIATTISSLDPAYRALNGKIAPQQVTVVDNDVPTVSLYSGLSASELSSTPGFFVVELNSPTLANDTGLVVNYRVVDKATGNAIAGSDYQPLTGKLRIAPGETRGFIDIVPIDDKLAELNDVGAAKEHVAIELLAGTGYILDPGNTQAEIVINDDDKPGIQIIEPGAYTSIIEGNTETVYVSLLSEPTKDVYITLSTSNKVEDKYQLGFGEGENPPQTKILKFTKDNWYLTQPVTIQAIDDSLIEKGEYHTANIDYTVTSEDATYNNFAVEPQTIRIVDRLLDSEAVIAAFDKGLDGIVDIFGSLELPGIGSQKELVKDAISPVKNEILASLGVSSENQGTRSSLTQSTRLSQSGQPTVLPNVPNRLLSTKKGWSASNIEATIEAAIKKVPAFRDFDLEVKMNNRDVLFDFKLPIELSYSTPTVDFNASSGTRGFGAGFDVEGGLKFKANLDLNFAMGISLPSTSTSFVGQNIGSQLVSSLKSTIGSLVFIDTEKTQIKASIAGGLTNNSKISGQIGPLKLSASNDPDNPTQIGAEFTLKLKDIDNRRSIAFLDVNNNGLLDANEPFTNTDENGAFYTKNPNSGANPPENYLGLEGSSTPSTVTTVVPNPTTTGVVRGESSGSVIIANAPATTIDKNGNKIYDPKGYYKLEGVYRSTVGTAADPKKFYFDANRNNTLDAGELFTTQDTLFDKTFTLKEVDENGQKKYYFDSDGDGEISTTEKAVDAAIFDRNGNHQLDADIDYREKGEGVFITSPGLAFVDKNNNQKLDIGEAFINAGFGEFEVPEIETDFVDLDGDGKYSIQEPKIVSTGQAKATAYNESDRDRSGVRFVDFNGNRLWDRFEMGANNNEGDYKFALDPNPTKVNSLFYFFDSNGNGKIDLGEAYTDDPAKFGTTFDLKADGNGNLYYDRNNNGILDVDLDEDISDYQDLNDNRKLDAGDAIVAKIAEKDGLKFLDRLGDGERDNNDPVVRSFDGNNYLDLNNDGNFDNLEPLEVDGKFELPELAASWLRPDTINTVGFATSTYTPVEEIFAKTAASNNKFYHVLPTLHSFGNISSPTFADIDNDGDLDILVGNKDGIIKAVYNLGTATIPFFNPNTPGEVAAPLGFVVNPTTVDIDDDKDLDLVIGSNDGKLNTYENIGTIEKPQWQKMSGDRNPLADINSSDKAYQNSQPIFADINGDNLQDLIIGASDGKIYTWLNQAGSGLQFAASEKNPFNGIDVGDNAAIALADLDDDGDLDATIVHRQLSATNQDGVLGTIGSVLSDSLFQWKIEYYRNDGTTKVAKFEKVDRSKDPFAAMSDVGQYGRPSFGDLDADGDLDLILGNSNGTINFVKNNGTKKVANFSLVSVTENPFTAGDRALEINANGRLIASTGGRFLDLNGNGIMDVGEPRSASATAPIKFPTNAIVNSIEISSTSAGTQNADRQQVYDSYGIFIDIDGNSKQDTEDPNIRIQADDNGRSVRYIDLDRNGKLTVAEDGEYLEPFSVQNNQYDFWRFDKAKQNDGNIVFYNDDRDRLTLGELITIKDAKRTDFVTGKPVDVTLKDVLSTEIAGAINVGLQAKATIAEGAGPSISTDLGINIPLFNFDNQGTGSGFLTNPIAFNFNDIQFDVGAWASGGILPVLKFANKYIVDPVRPILSALSADTKIFSYLGLTSAYDLNGDQKVSVAEAIYAFSAIKGNREKEAAASIVKWVSVITQIAEVVDTLAKTPDSESIILEFGDYTKTINNFKTNTGDDAIDSNVSNNTTGTVSGSTSTLTPEEAKKAQETHKNNLQKIEAKSSSGFLSKIKGLKGFNLDILQPSEVFKAISGETANIISWELPNPSTAIQTSVPLGKFTVGPLLASFSVDMGARLDARLKVGVDTDGIYISDWDANGNDVDELTFKANLSPKVSLSAYVAKLGFQGGVEGKAALDLFDVGEATGKSDGKVRFSEILEQGWNIFELTGSLEAYLKGELKVGIDTGFFEVMQTVWEQELGRIKLAEFKLGGGGGFQGEVVRTHGTAVEGIPIAPQNFSPGFDRLERLTVAAGGTQVITNELLKASDAEQLAADTIYQIIELPTHGKLQLAGQDLTSTDVFTQADIDAGNLSYTSNEGSADRLRFIVTDGTGGNTPVGTIFVNRPQIAVAANGLITNDRTPEISGKVTHPTAVVTVIISVPVIKEETDADGNNSVQLVVEERTYTATNRGDGTWYIPDNILAELPDGGYNVKVVATDNEAEDSTTASFALNLVVDTVAPNLPKITPATTTSASTTPIILGTADAYNKIAISVDGVAIGTTLADANGNWRFDNPQPLAEGERIFTVAAEDLAGNVTTASESYRLKIDRTLPVVTLSLAENTLPGFTPFTVKATLSEKTTALTAANFNLTNGTIAKIDRADDLNYTVTVVPTTAGLVSLSVAETAIADLAGNPNSASNILSTVREPDTIAPTVKLAIVSDSQIDPSAANEEKLVFAPFNFTATLSEATGELTAASFKVTNGTITKIDRQNDSSYLVEVTPTDTGLVSVAMAAAQTTDAAGNGNSASNTIFVVNKLAAKEDSFIANDGATKLDVLANDIGRKLEIVSFSQPIYGEVKLDDNGTADSQDDRLVYMPRIAPEEIKFDNSQLGIFQIGKRNEAPIVDRLTYQAKDIDGSIHNSSVEVLVSNAPINLKFTLTGNEAAYINEVAVFKIDDSLGTINGLKPGDTGYDVAALKASRVVFSSLSDRDKLFDRHPSRILDGFKSNDRLGFLLVQNDTLDNALAAIATGKTPPTTIFGIPNSNADSQAHVKVADLTTGGFTVQWEDNIQGVDWDWNDLVMQVEATTEAVKMGSRNNPGMEEAIDLRGVQTPLVMDYQTISEAAFDNHVGFYAVNDDRGTIFDATTNRLLLPTDEGYAKAAISQRLSFEIGQNASGQNMPLPTDRLLVPYLIANGTAAEFLAANAENKTDLGPQAYFSYLGANPDKSDHIRLLADRTYGFEDLYASSNGDFNDVILSYNVRDLN